MVGTATEVAPVRAVDDREIGVGPVTRELQKAYLDTVEGRTSAGATGSTSSRCRPRRHSSSRGVRPDDPALRARGSTSGRRSSSPRCSRSGSPLARPDDRPFRGGVRRGGRRAVRRRRLERHGGASPALHRCRGRPRRRGRHVAVLLRRVGQLRDLRRGDAGVRRHRPADAEPHSGGGRGCAHRPHARGRRGRHLRLPL